MQKNLSQGIFPRFLSSTLMYRKEVVAVAVFADRLSINALLVLNRVWRTNGEKEG
jgi:hypothetical protein